MTRNEFEFEPIRGLPERLPEGESILWQGAPNWWGLARSAFHVRKVAVYFAILMIWHISSSLWDGKGIQDAAAGASVLLGVGVVAVALLTLLAWMQARSTVYTITNRRVVFRTGVALVLAINVPFRRIVSAGLRLNRDGSGDIPLALGSDDRVAYLHLWPHARPWRFTRPEPMLRAVPDVAKVAKILTRALEDASEPQDVPKVVRNPRDKSRTMPQCSVAAVAAE